MQEGKGEEKRSRGSAPGADDEPWATTITMSRARPVATRRALAVLLGLLLMPGSTCVPALAATSQPGYVAHLPIPPRRQWEANYGYCGEVSLISAGLYFGQYCSQYKARQLSSPGIPQSDSDSQLLVGVNDVQAADAMHLEASPWDTESQMSTGEFLAWVKQHSVAGHPVIIGLFTNEYLFHEDTDRYAGDPDYDHIVPVTGIGSLRPLDGWPVRYLRSDSITFSDNGLWAPDGVPPYVFSSRFAGFARGRRAANSSRAPVYSLNNNLLNYGIAVTGVKDPGHHTIPVRLATNVNHETPAMVEGSNAPPAPSPLTITAMVGIPDPSVSYNLYRYDSFADVPDTSFNASAADAAQVWNIPAGSGATYSVDVGIMSDDVAVFRAVRASAP